MCSSTQSSLGVQYRHSLLAPSNNETRTVSVFVQAQSGLTSNFVTIDLSWSDPFLPRVRYDAATQYGEAGHVSYTEQQVMPVQLAPAVSFLAARTFSSIQVTLR